MLLSDDMPSCALSDDQMYLDGLLHVLCLQFAGDIVTGSPGQQAKL